MCGKIGLISASRSFFINVEISLSQIEITDESYRRRFALRWLVVWLRTKQAGCSHQPTINGTVADRPHYANNKHSFSLQFESGASFWGLVAGLFSRCARKSRNNDDDRYCIIYADLHRVGLPNICPDHNQSALYGNWAFKPANESAVEATFCATRLDLRDLQTAETRLSTLKKKE